MKTAIKSAIYIGFSLLCANVFAATVAIEIYKGKRGDVVVVTSDGGRSFMIAGGASPRGAATAGDCFAKATLKIKRPPNYYEGELEPVKNEIADLSVEDVSGKGVGAYLFRNKIKIGNVEVDGICADGVDFSGYYHKLEVGDKRYESIFMYFMRLASQDAAYRESGGNVAAAINDLRPFVENYKEEWRANESNKNLIDLTNKKYRRLIGR